MEKKYTTGTFQTALAKVWENVNYYEYCRVLGLKEDDQSLQSWGQLNGAIRVLTVDHDTETLDNLISAAEAIIQKDNPIATDSVN